MLSDISWVMRKSDFCILDVKVPLCVHFTDLDKIEVQQCSLICPNVADCIDTAWRKYLSIKWTKTLMDLGPVVQSIVSLTTSLRRQLVKYMPTKLSNTLLFFIGKM